MANLELAMEVWDVFTDRPLTGNPLAVFFDASRLTEAQMRALARETNLSETTFILGHDSQRGYAVRIFTPVEELPFAGHPVLGTAMALYRRNPQQTSIHLDLKGGRIPVTIRKAANSDLPEGEMVQRDPTLGTIHLRGEIAPLIGLDVDRIATDAPCQTVSTGRARIQVPLKTLADIRAVRLDHAAIRDYCAKTDAAVGLYLVTRETEDKVARVHARNILAWTEDPVTGAAGGNCAAWMVAHGWASSGERVIIEQGSEVHRPGRMLVSAVKKGNSIVDVRVGGQAVKVMESRVFL